MEYAVQSDFVFLQLWRESNFVTTSAVELKISKPGVTQKGQIRTGVGKVTDNLTGEISISNYAISTTLATTGFDLKV